MDNEYFVHRINLACKKKCITPDSIEQEIEFSQGLISRWNSNSPTVDKVIDVANKLNVSVEYLFMESIVAVSLYDMACELIWQTNNNRRLNKLLGFILWILPSSIVGTYGTS